VDLDALLFDYKPALVRIIDTGRGIQMNVAGGLGVNVGGKRYELRYATFHRPAEVQVAGQVHDMEVQLVHEAGDGQWMVLALLIEAGSEHPVIQSVLNNLPLEQSLEVTPVSPVDVGKLLPDKRTYWTFMGSLNRPPCMEGVLWLVLKQPIQASVEQVAIFARLYAHNVRPIQPSNGRLIKESR
jgi:carbonic anhydrase